MPCCHLATSHYHALPEVMLTQFYAAIWYGSTRPQWVKRVKTGHRSKNTLHDDVIKWKYFPRYWPFVQGIRRSPVNSLHKGQLRGALGFSLICAWINSWVNKREDGDWRRHRAHYDVTVMSTIIIQTLISAGLEDYRLHVSLRSIPSILKSEKLYFK